VPPSSHVVLFYSLQFLKAGYGSYYISLYFPYVSLLRSSSDATYAYLVYFMWC